MKVTDFIGAKATYDERGQTIWGISKEGLYQKIADVRGWGAIRNMFLTPDGLVNEEKAMNFQDELGKWIVDAINEKLQREANQTPNLKPMKRFLVFAGDAYYTSFGMNDFQEDFDTLEEARSFEAKIKEKWESDWEDFKWSAIWDLETRTYV